MCKEDFKIHFCTCSNKEVVNIDFADEVKSLFEIKRTESQLAFFENDGSYHTTYFKWKLSSFKEKSNGVIGVMIYPKDKLDEYITLENILKELNTLICFDFKYIPKEKDLLEIEEKYNFIELKEHPRPYLDNYMSFKFENNKWVFGRYPLKYIHERVEIGKVEILKNN
ncbi:hypothetical protein [uncultured Dokdonia sp.]|uniref:hypothetical protein n=1 Tax=uncultured Dokdonia sp. TaxID=575653 RepID=UPI0026297A6D|nr:hypothetical protein [uncultured Dokdonia sp.]